MEFPTLNEYFKMADSCCIQQQQIFWLQCKYHTALSACMYTNVFHNANVMITSLNLCSLKTDIGSHVISINQKHLVIDPLLENKDHVDTAQGPHPLNWISYRSHV